MSLAEARDAWNDTKKVRDDPARGDPRPARKALVAAAEAKRIDGYTVRELLEGHFTHHAEKLAKGIEQEPMLRQDVLPQWGIGPPERSRVGTSLTSTRGSPSEPRGWPR